ncbi:MAG TPA: HEAT repeat domain-containing protein [Longimicrobiales bacterium]|nr:HEAT repeat domain-containing protein [Longimicrobiales bacterium]
MTALPLTDVIDAASALTIAALVAAAGAVGLRIRNALVARRWERMEQRWAERLLDVLSGDGPPPDLGREIAPAERPYFIEFLGRFVRRVAGPERERLLAVARPLLPGIRPRLRAWSAARRAVAVDTFGLLAPPGPGDELVAALDDHSPFVAMVAARALARRPTPDHARAMVAHLQRFDRWRPSYLAAILAAFGPEIAPALRSRLGDRTLSPGIRAAAADALSRLNDPQAADAAAATLPGEPDPEVRAALVRVLGQVGRPEHLPLVRQAAEAPEAAVRLAAIRTLGAIGGPADVERLAAALHDPSRWVAEHAARGLARAGRGELLAPVAAGEGTAALIAREVLAEAAP